jgi:serine/threonine protein kinase
VMELMEGEGLDVRLARAGVFRPGEAAAAVAFVARGLEEAHVRGLVHRDLKPANVFFAIDDRGDIVPKVLDFGVSKATEEADPKFVRTNTGAVLGSPAYMSPEQARGEEDIDGRSDVWSLGVILYECLTGRTPFDGANYNQLMVNIINEPCRPIEELNPSLPRELCDVVGRALEKDRARRVGTARELAEHLELVASRISSTPYPGMVMTRTRTLVPPPASSPTPVDAWTDRPARRRRPAVSPLVWVSGAVLATVGLFVGGLAVTRSQSPVAEVAIHAATILSDARDRERVALAAMPVESSAPAALPSSAAPLPSASSAASASVSRAAPAAATPATPLGPAKRPKNPNAHDGVENPGF